MDELGAKGPWAECVISTGLYHCASLTQILELPGIVICVRPRNNTVNLILTLFKMILLSCLILCHLFAILWLF